MYCSRCGAQSAPGSVFCSKCGAELRIEKKRTSKVKKTVIIVTSVLALALIAGFCYFKFIRGSFGSSPVISGDNRRPSVYTFLVLGMDDGNGNTDTIMAATLDTTEHTLHVVNIPRDTMVNVPWKTKKANSIYANARAAAKDRKDTDEIMEIVNSRFADILGYEPDFYSIVDMKAFAALIDAIGGVKFDVPQAMDYDDPAQNLSIHIAKGSQRLKGKDALGYVRFRSGYNTADIGRIEAQQAFLKAAVEQILENKEKINVTSIISIYLSDVETNLTAPNLIWFAEELFKLDAENITFEKIPADYSDSSGNCAIFVDEWLELLNEKLNPFDYKLKEKDLSILTRSNGRGSDLYVTDGKSK